jgi:hypothetical protein
MRRRNMRFGCSFLFLIAAPLVYSTPACISGNSLLSYEALGATGCTIGPQTVDNFSFTASTSITAADVTVTTVFGVGFYGIQFSSPDFSTSGSANYSIGYTWDSLPIRGLGAALDPAPVDMVTNGCVGAAFVGPTCSGTLVSVEVFEPSPLADTVFFSPTAVLGISNSITLTDSSCTPMTDCLFENDVYVVPEPVTFLLTGLGVMMLAIWNRRRRSGVEAPTVISG